MLGDKIRELRKSKEMTLNHLAEAAGVTASYISQLERNIIDPSISSLRKISKVLEVPMYTFLDDDGKEPITLIKADRRQKLELPDSSITYEYLTPIGSTVTTATKMEVVYFQLNPKSWSSEESLHHKAEECIVIIKGSVKLYIGEDSYDLEEGDSVYIRENAPHKLYNDSTRKAIGISCITPAI